MKQIHRQHLILIMKAEHIRIIPFDRGNALLLLQLLHRRNQIAIARRALKFLYLRRLRHAHAQRFHQIRLPPLE